MKTIIALFIVAFVSACTTVSLPFDGTTVANAVNSEGNAVLGRDWNNQPSESQGTAGNGDGQ